MRMMVGEVTVIRTMMVSRKASSSASDLRISGSVEMLMRIVRAFFAMGWKEGVFFLLAVRAAWDGCGEEGS